MKKQNKKSMKNTRMGRNIYGQHCIAKEVILTKENAIDQYIEVLNDIEQHRKMNINIEYDVKMPKDIFTQEEIEALSRQIRNLTMLRSAKLNTPYRDVAAPVFPAAMMAI